TGEASMPSQTIRAFGEQSRTFGRRTFRRFAVLLAVLLLLTATLAAFAYAAPSPQKNNQSAARKTFDEGERLRRQATPDSLRGAVEKYEESLRLWHESGDRASETAALATLGLTLQLLHQHEKAIEV
ncbi:MAG: hypothetical protein DMF65_14130, partial [Acidobacteria bacterium]